jgi:hypothetical protein
MKHLGLAAGGWVTIEEKPGLLVLKKVDWR